MNDFPSISVRPTLVRQDACYITIQEDLSHEEKMKKLFDCDVERMRIREAFFKFEKEVNSYVYSLGS